MNKSAIVGDENFSKAGALPDKLVKMKERLKRDRSANLTYKDVHRGISETNSLYGRKRVGDSIDEKTQRLRESYNKHRKPNSRS